MIFIYDYIYSTISSDKECSKSNLLTDVAQIVHTDYKLNTQMINLGRTERYKCNTHMVKLKLMHFQWCPAIEEGMVRWRDGDFRLFSKREKYYPLAIL